MKRSESATSVDRTRWAPIALALLMPLIAGTIVGLLQVQDPFSDRYIAVSWIVYSLAMAAPIGFATWLTWRFQFTGKHWRKLACYSPLLAPPSLLYSTLVMRVSLFVQSTSIEVFHPGVSFVLGATIAAEIYPDCLQFTTLVSTLWVIRWLTGISLVRDREPARPPARFTIRSILALTFVASTMFLIIKLTMQSNIAAFAKRGFSHSPFNWANILGIVTPISSGIAIAVALYLLATTSLRSFRHALIHPVLAFAVLLLPSILEKQLFVLIKFAPANVSILPSIFNILGGLSTLLVCAGCLRVLKWSGIRIEFEQKNTASRTRLISQQKCLAHE